MSTIHVGEGEELSAVLGELLDLADHPSQVFYVPGTRDVEVPEELAGRFLDARSSDPAPRKRAPRKPRTGE